MSQQQQSHKLKDNIEKNPDPGEITPNAMMEERMCLDEMKNFELEVNYIELEQMDFDLSKKDNDSPHENDTQLFGQSENAEANDKKKDKEKDTCAMKKEKSPMSESTPHIQEENHLQLTQNSVLTTNNNPPTQSATHGQPMTEEDNPAIECQPDLVFVQIANTNTFVQQTHPMPIVQTTLEIDPTQSQPHNPEETSHNQLEHQHPLYLPTPYFSQQNQNRSQSSAESLIIQSPIEKIELKLLPQNPYKREVQSPLNIKQENYPQHPIPQKLQYHLLDSKSQSPQNDKNHQFYHNPNPSKTSFEKQQSLYDSESNSDSLLKTTLHKEQTPIHSLPTINEKNLLKEFKNEPYEVRDKYFQRQSEIYKKYILNMKNTLRKQYQRCRTLQIESQSHSKQQPHERTYKITPIQSFEKKPTIAQSNYSQPSKQQYIYYKKNESLDIRSGIKHHNSNNKIDYQFSGQFIELLDDQSDNNKNRQNDFDNQVRTGRFDHSDTSFHFYLKHITQEMSNFIDLSDRIDELIQMDYQELMQFYASVVGDENVLAYEVFKNKWSEQREYGQPRRDDMSREGEKEAIVEDCNKAGGYQHSGDIMINQNSKNSLSNLQKQPQLSNPHHPFQPSPKSPITPLSATQKNTHLQTSPLIQISQSKSIQIQQFGQKVSSSSKMSLQQGQVTSQMINELQQIAINDQECTPMFGQQVGVVVGNCDDNNANSKDKGIKQNVEVFNTGDTVEGMKPNEQSNDKIVIQQQQHQKQQKEHQHQSSHASTTAITPQPTVITNITQTPLPTPSKPPSSSSIEIESGQGRKDIDQMSAEQLREWIKNSFVKKTEKAATQNPASTQKLAQSQQRTLIIAQSREIIPIRGDSKDNMRQESKQQASKPFGHDSMVDNQQASNAIDVESVNEMAVKANNTTEAIGQRVQEQNGDINNCTTTINNHHKDYNHQPQAQKPPLKEGQISSTALAGQQMIDEGVQADRSRSEKQKQSDHIIGQRRLEVVQPTGVDTSIGVEQGDLVVKDTQHLNHRVLQTVAIVMEPHHEAANVEAAHNLSNNTTIANTTNEQQHNIPSSHNNNQPINANHIVEEKTYHTHNQSLIQTSQNTTQQPHPANTSIDTIATHTQPVVTTIPNIITPPTTEKIIQEGSSNAIVTKPSNPNVIELIDSSSEEEISVPVKPSSSIINNNSNVNNMNSNNTVSQHNNKNTENQNNPPTSNPPQPQTLPTTSQQPPSTSHRVSARDVRALLLEQYPNIENMINAASDEEILTLYYELTGKEDSSQQQQQQLVQNVGISNTIVEEQGKQGEGMNDGGKVTGMNINSGNDINVNSRNQIVLENKQHNHQHDVSSQIQAQHHTQHHPTHHQHQPPQPLQTPTNPSQPSIQPADHAFTYKQQLTQQQLDLVIKNLIESNLQLKDQISQLSRQDLYMLYKQGIRQRMNMVGSQQPEEHSNSSQKLIRPSDKRKKNKHQVKEVIDLEDDDDGNCNSNISHNVAPQVYDESVNYELHAGFPTEQSPLPTTNNKENTINSHHQQQSTPTSTKPSFSYLQLYKQQLHQQSNPKTTPLQPQTFIINKTLLYALLQAHDYKKSLHSILKPKQSLKYQQRTEKQIAAIYLNHLKKNRIKNGGLEKVKENEKSMNKDSLPFQQQGFVILANHVKESDIQSQTFKKAINPNVKLTVQRPPLSQQRKARILELRNQRIQAEKQLLLNPVIKSTNLFNEKSTANAAQPIPILQSPYLNNLLAAPQKTQRRYWLMVEEESLDPRDMQRLEEEIGLQSGMKRVKRSVIQRDEKQIAKMIKTLAQNISNDIELQ